MPRPGLSKSDREEIARRYKNGESGTELSREFQCGWSSLYRYIRAEGGIIRPQPILKRGYTLRQDAFRHAESDPQAAYWTGFLMADGSVSSRRQPTIALSIGVDDAEHVVKFRDFLGSNHKIGRQKGSGYVGSRGLISIAITSREILTDLARYGVIPRKSSREKVLLLDKNPDFWRGMIDGDGHVSMLGKGRKHPTVGITGGLLLMHQFANFCDSIGIPGRTISKNHSIWKVTVNCSFAIILLNSVYAAPCVALDRKHEKAKECLLWRSLRPDRSEWTAERLREMKQQHGTWQRLGEQLGVSGNSLAVLYSHRLKKEI